ncbi:tetratricopeptide repeat protein [bacterium]|nr:tetratricopeptide repeat protein [candidate division CSSED10-310 bacterium]
MVEKRRLSKCTVMMDLAIPYLDGRLSVAQRTAVEEHLQSCVACRREFRIFEALRRLSDAKEKGAVDPVFFESPVPVDLDGVSGKGPTLSTVLEMLSAVAVSTESLEEKRRAMIAHVHWFLTEARAFLQSRPVIRAGKEWLKLEKQLARLLRRILEHPIATGLRPLMAHQADAYASRGLIFQLQGDVRQAERYLSHSVVILWALKQPEALQTQRFLGELKFYEGDAAAAEELFIGALEDPRTPPREQAILMRNLGNTAYVRGRVDESRHFLEQAMALSATLGESELPARDLMNLSALDFHHGDTELAIRHTREAIRLLNTSADVHLLGQLHANLGTFLAMTGTPDDAQCHWERAIHCFQASYWTRDVVQVRRNMALNAYESGLHDHARSILAAALTETSGTDALSVQLQLLAARIDRKHRRFESATSLLDTAETLAQSLNESLLLDAVRLEQAFLALIRQSIDRAAAILETTSAVKKRRPIGSPSIFDIENEAIIASLFEQTGRTVDADRCRKRLHRMIRTFRKMHPGQDLPEEIPV